MIRFFDIIFSFIGLLLLFPIMVIIFIINWIHVGSPIYVQKRVGHLKKPFKLIKFRSLKLRTKSIPSHHIKINDVTRFGKILRSTKLDEITQLWNVLIGDMSIVGPRPCLFSQKELIYERDKKKIFLYKPGITGLTQFQGLTMKDPKIMVKNEYYMLNNFTIRKYFYYIFMTFVSIFKNKFKN